MKVSMSVYVHTVDACIYSRLTYTPICSEYLVCISNMSQCHIQYISHLYCTVM